jgi:hypothetical protein
MRQRARSSGNGRFDPSRLAEETLLAFGYSGNRLIKAAEVGLCSGSAGQEDRPRDQRLMPLTGVGASAASGATSA